MSHENENPSPHVKALTLAHHSCHPLPSGRIVLMVADADHRGVPIVLDASDAEDVAVALLSCLMDMGTSLLGGDA